MAVLAFFNFLYVEFVSMWFFGSFCLVTYDARVGLISVLVRAHYLIIIIIRRCIKQTQQRKKDDGIL